MNLDAKGLYGKKQMNLAIFGLAIAFIAAIANTTFQNFNVAATGIISESFASTLLASYVLSLITLAVCEIIGGIIMICFNSASGIPLAEYKRIWKVKSSRTILVSSVLGGPIGTACAVMAIALCGSTYTNCIIGLTPAVTAILGIIFLKEKAGARVFLGIIICVIGALMATFAPPEDVPNFFLGILIACICPLGYSLENIISTHAVDVSDPRVACPLYRMLGSACIELAIAVIVCAVTGHMAWIGSAFQIMTSSGACMLFLVLTAVFMAIQYNGTYSAYTYCGAIKASAILWTGTFWTIPIGFAMQAMGILEYSVTGLGIAGAIAVVVGIFIVVANPKELFSLRN